MKNSLFTSKNALAYVLHRWRWSFKFQSRRIGPGIERESVRLGIPIYGFLESGKVGRQKTGFIRTNVDVVLEDQPVVDFARLAWRCKTRVVNFDSTWVGCQTLRDAIYPNGEKYTKWTYFRYTKSQQSIQNDRKIYRMAITYVYQHFPFQGSLKFTQSGILGFKIYHLATLVVTRDRRIGSGSFTRESRWGNGDRHMRLFMR
jgi:hypothetical protein